MVEVEQVGESKVLWVHNTFTTEVRVVEDDSDPQRLRTQFELIRSVRRQANCTEFASVTMLEMRPFVLSLLLQDIDCCLELFGSIARLPLVLVSCLG